MDLSQVFLHLVEALAQVLKEDSNGGFATLASFFLVPEEIILRC